ncbi:MAG: hypothetical protein ACRD0J_17810, partial [Acidimicrobiales bacterium]
MTGVAEALAEAVGVVTEGLDPTAIPPPAMVGVAKAMAGESMAASLTDERHHRAGSAQAVHA